MCEQDDLGGRWVDFASAVALIGVNPTELAWAMVHEVTFSTRVPGHEGQPMLCVESLYRWAGLASEPLAPEPLAPEPLAPEPTDPCPVPADGAGLAQHVAERSRPQVSG